MSHLIFFFKVIFVSVIAAMVSYFNIQLNFRLFTYRFDELLGFYPSSFIFGLFDNEMDCC
jgi:hypothetical protein